VTTKSPYTRYDKTPYQYQFKRCAHRGARLYQQTPNWHGEVCAICNIILKNLDHGRSNSDHAKAAHR
jgi:hypothetical protein